MKITKEEKMYLERCGYGRKDLAQIREAIREDKTTYEMDGASITREEAVTRLGRLDYLSGIARSAFHFTAMRLSLIHISEPRDRTRSRMPSSA